jgi:hypothetical protein
MPNLASRVLALCERRVGADWQHRFGHPPGRNRSPAD